MNRKILNNLKDLKNLSSLIKPDNMDSFNEILSLYESRKIKQLDTAQKMILKLASSRGKGKQATKTKISNISQGVKHIKKPNPFIRTKKSKNYYITANIDTNIQYISSLKNGKTRFIMFTNQFLKR